MPGIRNYPQREAHCDTCDEELSQRLDSKGHDKPCLFDPATEAYYCDEGCEGMFGLANAWVIWLDSRCPWAKATSLEAPGEAIQARISAPSVSTSSTLPDQP